MPAITTRRAPATAAAPHAERVVTVVLHQHPSASYCQKVLIALYELELHPVDP
jgi:hypothetical protein